MKILNKKILNKAAIFLLLAVLLCWNALKVEAYTALDGYPFEFDNMKYIIENLNNEYLYDSNGVKISDNLYQWEISNTVFNDVSQVYFGNLSEDFIFPFNSDKYDYYLVGTYSTFVNTSNDFSFFPDSVSCTHYDENLNYYSLNCYDVNFYNYSNEHSKGFSFSFEIDFNDVNSTFSLIRFRDNSGGSVGGSAIFSASIVPVAKGSEAEQLNQSILNELIKINQNLVTSNSLQQSTIDAINQNTTNITNWFTTLISNLSTWYYQRKEDLSNWFLDIDNRLSSGFAALYSQMTKEQDEKLNGYDDTTQSDAAASFSSESDKLTSLEGELSTQGNDFVNDYTSDGFDTGVLTTLGSSLIFVATWFTNFWNMGGVFTATLNLCFALSIVFFIFRIKR